MAGAVELALEPYDAHVMWSQMRRTAKIVRDMVSCDGEKADHLAIRNLSIVGSGAYMLSQEAEIKAWRIYPISGQLLSEACFGDPTISQPTLSHTWMDMSRHALSRKNKARE